MDPRGSLEPAPCPLLLLRDDPLALTQAALLEFLPGTPYEVLKQQVYRHLCSQHLFILEHYRSKVSLSSPPL